jgi:hypothetical protein
MPLNPDGHRMTRAYHHNREDRKTWSLRPILSSVVNFPVLLSVLFVVQFVPVEHLHCLFADRPAPMMMDCHGAMTKGGNVAPSDEAGSPACCPGMPATHRSQAQTGVKPCCVDRDQSPRVVLQQDVNAHTTELALPPGTSVFEKGPIANTGPPVAADYGPVNLHVLNSTFLI